MDVTHCLFQYISSPMEARISLRSGPTLQTQLGDEPMFLQILITYTSHSNNPCFQNAAQVKPVQRHEFYNNNLLVKTLLQCAKPSLCSRWCIVVLHACVTAL